MTNNDIFKKLRVALMLRDDQIVEILELVDFRISKSELGAFFRDEKHENFVVCGDQVLRNFLNGLVIYLRGTKDNPKIPKEVLAKHKNQTQNNEIYNSPPKLEQVKKSNFKRKPLDRKNPNKKSDTKIQVVEKVKYNNGKKK